jgi:hypothetical protein
VKLPPALARTLPPGVGVNLAALGTDIPEREFQRALIALAESLGWKVYSVPDSRRASAGGYPDLTGMRGERVWVAELKKVGEKPRADQQAWLDAYRAMGVPAYHWTPADLDTIHEVLR